MTEFQPDDADTLFRSIVKRLGILERHAAGGSSSGSLADVGDVKMTARSSAPSGWLICDGTAVSRTTYAALFSAIGTTYGAGDGSTTFNVPNAKGRAVVGRDAAQTEFDTLGETGGSKTQTLTIANLPAHGHTQRAHTGAIASGGGSAIAGMTLTGGDIPGTPAEQTTTDTGSGTAHNNLQPYIVMNYIIKT